MADFPYMPLWWDAYWLDCSHLSDAEHGRYLLILKELWTAPKQRIPNDDEWLAKRFRRSPEAVRTEIRTLLKEFCQRDGNWWKQKRLSAVWNASAEQRQKQSDRAKSRWNKEKDACRGNAAPGNANQNQNQRKGRAKGSTPSLKKDPASPDHASRTSAAQVGRAGGAPPAQDKETNNQLWQDTPHAEILRALRYEVYDTTGAAADDKQVASFKRLIAKLDDKAVRAMAAKTEAGKIGEPRAYLMTTIRDAKANDAA